MTWLSGEVAEGWGGDGAVPGQGLEQLLFPSGSQGSCRPSAASTLNTFASTVFSLLDLVRVLSFFSAWVGSICWDHVDFVGSRLGLSFTY